MGSYNEIYGDALNYIRDDCPLVHCISADYALGAGIAKQVEDRYKVRLELNNYGSGKYPDVIKVKNVINMVTKSRYWNKPTYQSFRIALTMVKDLLKENNIKNVVMPRIGSGLDRLDWEICRGMIQLELCNNDINVIVCYI